MEARMSCDRCPDDCKDCAKAWRKLALESGIVKTDSVKFIDKPSKYSVDRVVFDDCCFMNDELNNTTCIHTMKENEKCQQSRFVTD